MDIELVTILFCFMLLILNIMIFSRQTAFFNLYSHSLDLKLSEAERMRTILQTLQQIESKIDFNEQSHPTQEHEVKKKRGRPSKAPQK